MKNAAKEKKSTKKKILVGVWKDLIDLLNKKVDAACLNRDAYLDHVFRHEAERLTAEVEIANSAEARSHLSTQLSLLERKPVSFALSPATIEAIDAACAAKNLPRDCLFNRVLFLLVVDQRTLFRALLLDPKDYWPEALSRYGRIWDDTLIAGSLSLVGNVIADDPFFAIRECIAVAREEHGTDAVPFLHTMLIPADLLGAKVPSMLGLNCYLPDSMIEGHPAQIASALRMEELLMALGERDAAPTLGAKP